MTTSNKLFSLNPLQPLDHSCIIIPMDSATNTTKATTMSQDIIDLALSNMAKWRKSYFVKTLAEYNHCCAVCGESNPFHLQLDHVEPTSAGGEDDPSNWQVLCGPCNNVKNDIEGMARIPARQPEENTQAKVAAHVAFRVACQADR